MKTILLLVGPPGSGKSTFAKTHKDLGYVYINQDAQGKVLHKELFDKAILAGESIVVDRLNFNKEQRNRYLVPAKSNGYSTRIVVLHESYQTCLNRCMMRENHETIKHEKNAEAALNMFFTKYERVTDDEADVVNRVWPDCEKLPAVWSDLDGTLANCEHRRHFVKPDRPLAEGEKFKKNWKGFFDGMINDKVNPQVLAVLKEFYANYEVAYCTGRPDTYKTETKEWLRVNAPVGKLYMRNHNDSRPDYIVKEIMLDFEILTRYELFFCLDDRNQVVGMLRNRGFVVFQVADGDF